MSNNDVRLNMGPVNQLLRQLAERDMRLHSLIAYRHGRIVLDLWCWPHEPDRKHKLHSATAVGFAEAKGLLGLEDRLVD